MIRVPEPQEPFDPFTLLGLDRQFECNPAEIRTSYETLIHHERAKPEDLPVFDHARDILVDPVQRGRRLLELLGGIGEPDTADVPPDLQGRLNTLQNLGDSPARLPMIQLERAALLEQITTLFTALHALDAPDIQRERRQRVRAFLNALEQLDRLTTLHS